MARCHLSRRTAVFEAYGSSAIESRAGSVAGATRRRVRSHPGGRRRDNIPVRGRPLGRLIMALPVIRSTQLISRSGRDFGVARDHPCRLPRPSRRGEITRSTTTTATMTMTTGSPTLSCGKYASSAASCPRRAAAAGSRSYAANPLPDTIVAAQHRSSRGLSMTSNVRGSRVAALRCVRASRSARSRKMRRPWRAEDQVCCHLFRPR